MVTIEELRRRREKAALKLMPFAGKVAERKEKQLVKQDIRRIKAARFRGQFRLSKDNVEKAGNIFKGSAKAILSGGKVLAKGLMGAGEAANELYGAGRKKKRR